MNGELKPYPKNKESGLPWLGKVPEHWELKPAFGAFSPIQERNTGMQERVILSLSYGRIIVKSKDKLHGLVPGSFETYQIVNPGDIIIRTTDLQNDHTSLHIGMVKNRGIITSAYLALQVRKGVSPEFGFQFLNTWDISKAIYEYGSGLRQSLGFSDFKRMPIPIPPPAEQAAIVKYLGYSTSRIDAAIAAKKKIIALLEEEKRAIIQKAVTKGLDPKVKMKDSGVPWIGEIPEGWSIFRLKFVFHEVDERSENGNELHLSMSQKYGLVPHNELTERRLVSESYAGAKLCKKGDLVLNRLKAHLGVFAIAPCDGVISPDYSVFRVGTRRVNVEYAEALLKTSQCRRELIIRTKGIVEGFWRLYTEDFYDIAIPFPPIEEQLKISENTHRIETEYSLKISKVNNQLFLLHEYRTRLVADVVTGKLDVRKAVEGLPELAEAALDVEDAVGDTDDEGGAEEDA